MNDIKFLKPNTWDYGMAISALPGMLLTSYDAYKYGYTPEDITRDAGYSMGNYGGVGFQRANNIDESGLRKELRADNAKSILGTVATGASLGAAAGPIGAGVGAVVGGIVGGIGAAVKSHSMNKKILEARNSNYRTNTINEAVAAGQAMNNEWNLSFMNTYNLIRHGADGIDNARLQYNETVVDDKGNAETIKTGTPGVDKVKAFLLPNQGVITNKLGLSEITNAYADVQDYIKNRMLEIGDKVNKNSKSDLNLKIATNVAKGNKEVKDLVSLYKYTQDGVKQAQLLQKWLRDNNILAKGDNYTPTPNNDTPIHAAAGLDNIIINGSSGLIGLGLFIQADGQRVKNPNTYVSNPYAPQAINTMDSLNIPIYPILSQTRDAEARGRYLISNSGGLSSSQKLAGNVSLTSNTLSNIAQNMFNYYKELNALKAQAANLKFGAGQHAAQMMLNAAQWDLDYYSKAHAARLNMANMGIVNTIGSLRQYLADADTRKRFDDMYKLYKQDVETRSKQVVSLNTPLPLNVYYPSIVYPSINNGYGAPWWPNNE